jgi:protein-S-isoprenylcysteine O-methyltransferase Ste14
MENLGQQAFTGAAKFLAAIALLIFLPAWTIYYWQAWLYLAVFGLATLLQTAWLLRHDRALLARRLKAGPGQEKEKTQRVIQTVASLFTVGQYILSGLDRHFGWSKVPPALVIAANAGVAAGFLVIFFVFRENTFTSGIVEIAPEQQVVTTGPYALVRHPMYSGALLMFLCTPLALGSYRALVASCLLCAAMAVRILDEERFLLIHLDGYRAYMNHTRYRLIPGIW